MRMIIRYESGRRVEAILLAANAYEMRAIETGGDTLELVRAGDNWYTESGTALEIEALIPIPGVDVTRFCAGVYPRTLAAGGSSFAF